MAKPVITPTNAGTEDNVASSYDLTALTSPGGVFSTTQGFIGSDWFVSASWNGTLRLKKDGNSQMVPTYNAVGGGGNNSLKAFTWTQADDILDTVGGNNSPQSAVQNQVVGDWARWTVIADQNLRNFHWRGANNACGPFGTLQVTAVLGDGSATMAPFNLNHGTTGFGIAFVAGASPLNPTTLTVQVTCTAAPAGAAFFFNQLGWLDIPIAPAIPRGAKRYFLGRGTGGRLA